MSTRTDGKRHTSELEQLVLRIQAGETERMPELWELTKKFAFKIARPMFPVARDRTGAEMSDLQQSCFLALLDAIKQYKPDTRFLTLYRFRIQSAFMAVSGQSNERIRNDPLNNRPDSLNRLVGDDNEPSELGELIPDENAEAAFSEIAETDYQEKMSAGIKQILKENLTEKQRQAIEMRYFCNYTLACIGNKMGISYQGADSLIKSGMKKLRSPKIKAKILEIEKNL